MKKIILKHCGVGVAFSHPATGNSKTETAFKIMSAHKTQWKDGKRTETAWPILGRNISNLLKVSLLIFELSKAMQDLFCVSFSFFRNNSQHFNPTLCMRKLPGKGTQKNNRKRDCNHSKRIQSKWLIHHEENLTDLTK